MAEATRHELEKAAKRERVELAEQTKPGPVYTPAVDIFEDADFITLLADMPGVTADSLKIDLRESVLTLTGDVQPPEGENETEVHREFETGSFYRQFTLSDMIDQSKISARLADGVLRLQLPKAVEAKPRKITVQST